MKTSTTGWAVEAVLNATVISRQRVKRMETSGGNCQTEWLAPEAIMELKWD